MNVDKDLFASYAFYAGICVLKTLGMAALTVRQRLSNKNCISAEDAALNPGSRVGVGLVEDVERVRRAHLNDMENIFPFWNMTVSYITFELRKLKEPPDAQNASVTPAGWEEKRISRLLKRIIRKFIFH